MTPVGNPFGDGRDGGTGTGHHAVGSGSAAVGSVSAAGARPSGSAISWALKKLGVAERRASLRTNKYQRQIIRLSVVPSACFCLVMYVLLEAFQRRVGNAIFSSSDAVSVVFVTEWGVVLVCTLLIYLAGIFLWSHVVSNRMVGAFERIVRELDEIVDGGERKLIVARQHDELANILLERINRLLKQLERSSARRSA